MSERTLRVCLPPDPNPRTPKFRAPPGSCDTHCHIFGPPNIFPYSEKRRYTPPAAPLEHYLQMLDIIGIDRGVVVQPNCHATDNAVSIDAIARSNGRLRGVGRVDDDTTDKEIERMHAGGIRGVRFEFVSGRAGSANIPLFDRVMQRVAPYNWAIELHTDPKVMVEHADWFRSIRANAIVDHYARLQTRDGIGQPAFTLLLDLLKRDNYWCKISGADERTGTPYPYPDILPFAHAVIATAPDRVIWGTNWPHSNLFEPGEIPNDGLLLDLMLDFAPDEAVRKKILVDNPARLFDFPPA